MSTRKPGGPAGKERAKGKGVDPDWDGDWLASSGSGRCARRCRHRLLDRLRRDPVVGLAGVAQARALLEDADFLEALQGGVDGPSRQAGLLAELLARHGLVPVQGAVHVL